MVNRIKLDNTELILKHYEVNEESKEVHIVFDVTSEYYHDTTSLLYKGQFDVHVPETGKDFTAEIVNYYTDRTNLYEENQTGEYTITLRKMKDESQ